MGTFNLRQFNKKVAEFPSGGIGFDKRRRSRFYDPYRKDDPENLGNPPINDTSDMKGVPDDENRWDGIFDGRSDGLMDNIDENRESKGVMDSSYYMDGARSNGDSGNGVYGQDDPTSPIGSEQTVLREFNSPNMDNKPNRLPSGGNQVKPFSRLRRLSFVDPMYWVRKIQFEKEVYLED